MGVCPDGPDRTREARSLRFVCPHFQLNEWGLPIMSPGNRLSQFQSARVQSQKQEELSGIQLPVFFVGGIVVLTSAINAFLLAPRRIDNAFAREAMSSALLDVDLTPEQVEGLRVATKTLVIVGGIVLMLGGVAIVVLGAFVPKSPQTMTILALVVFILVVLLSFVVDTLPVLSFFTVIKIVTGAVLVNSVRMAAALK